MFDYSYVVKFSNGNYYAGQLWSEKETNDLKHACMYVFDWSPMKDANLRFYCQENNLTYDLIKVKTITTYEIIEE